DYINNIINDGYLPIITGFQGINSNNDITTLGRSGSDISAVAIAAALQAKQCQIYTDVSGLCTADPREVTNAKKISHIQYNTASEISINGAYVIHPRAIEIAQRYNLTLEIKSTFLYNKSGTIIDNKIMEQQEIKSIASQSNDMLFEITKIKCSHSLLTAINSQNITIDILYHDFTSNKLLFKTHSQNKDLMINILNNMDYYSNTTLYENISIISIIGTGMILYSPITTQIIKYLDDHDIELIYLHTSEIKIQLIVEKKYLTLSLNLIHDLCKL
ncbi:MAG: aspartate kinase, partial [Anaplasmataceae bacterium]|nr:aspartate kinase [Anaplasmataceae bacterium]